MKTENEILIDALKELDTELAALGSEPFTADIIGQFAIIACEENNTCGFPEAAENAVKIIGDKYGLDKNRISAGIAEAGCTLGELEYSVGKLHFKDIAALKILRIRELVPEDLLRLKMIAVDTSVMLMSGGGKFTCAEELPEIERLMNELGITLPQLIDGGNGYIMDSVIYKVIGKYLKDRDLSYFDSFTLKELQKLRESDIY